MPRPLLVINGDRMLCVTKDERPTGAQLGLWLMLAVIARKEPKWWMDLRCSDGTPLTGLEILLSALGLLPGKRSRLRANFRRLMELAMVTKKQDCFHVEFIQPHQCGRPLRAYAQPAEHPLAKYLRLD